MVRFQGSIVYLNTYLSFCLQLFPTPHHFLFVLLLLTYKSCFWEIVRQCRHLAQWHRIMKTFLGKRRKNDLRRENKVLGKQTESPGIFCWLPFGCCHGCQPAEIRFLTLAFLASEAGSFLIVGVQCLAASLASTHQMPGGPPFVTSSNVSWHRGQYTPGSRIDPQLRSTAWDGGTEVPSTRGRRADGGRVLARGDSWAQEVACKFPRVEDGAAAASRGQPGWKCRLCISTGCRN